MEKATGVVRSIDGLGRLVIPKEIRRVLRIREGDPLEIFTVNDGSIVLRKYSPIGEMADFAAQYATALSASSKMITLITDKEKVVAVGGTNRANQIIGIKISEELYKQMESRKALMASKNDKSFINVIDDDFEFQHEIICPIVADCEVIGSVILLAKTGQNNPTDTELKLASCGAGFMGMHVE